MRTHLLVFIVSVLLILTACKQEKSNALLAYNSNEPLPHKQINIINLWASWCEPCRQEIPTLSLFAQTHPEVGVIGIAVDTPENVEKFLQTTEINYSVRYVTDNTAEMMQRFGNTTGGIPYTVIDAPKCHFRQPFFGVITAEQLTQGIENAKKQCQNQ